MSVWSAVCLFTHLSTRRLFALQSVCPAIRLSRHMSVQASVCPAVCMFSRLLIHFCLSSLLFALKSVCPAICLSTHLSVQLRISVELSVCLAVCLGHLSDCLGNCLLVVKLYTQISHYFFRLLIICVLSKPQNTPLNWNWRVSILFFLPLKNRRLICSETKLHCCPCAYFLLENERRFHVCLHCYSNNFLSDIWQCLQTCIFGLWLKVLV